MCLCIYYQSTELLWIKLVVDVVFFLLKGLAIIAFNDAKINSDTVKSVLSIGPAFAIMNFVESKLFFFLSYSSLRTASCKLLAMKSQKLILFLL